MNMRTKPSPTLRRSGVALVALSLLLPSGLAGAAEPAAPSNAPAAGESPSADAPPAAPLTPGQICSAAYERMQTEKLAGHYVAASAAALECSQLQCNAAIAKECLSFYGALEADTPTLVFSARKAEGGELTDVRVEMDGKLVAEQLTGRPFALDPGPHEFVFIHPQRGRMQVSETARVGDHARVVEATFADPFAKSADLTPALPLRKPGGVPVMTYVLGGVGLVGLGSFVYFRVRGVNDYNEYNATCSPACNPSDVDAVRQKFTISYVSLGVGIAGVAGAGLVYLLSPGRHGRGAVQASVAPRGDGAMAGLKTTF